MATQNSIARPYAQAAYEFARSKNEVSAWGNMLQAAALVIEDPAIAKLLTNTRVSSQQWFKLFSDILSSQLDTERKNFLHVLAEHKRLPVLPAIYALFKEREALDKKMSEVEVTTAIAMSSKQQQELTNKLTKTFNHQVSLRCVVDEHILGGAVVRAGDKVIDGSVRGQLTRLLEFAIQ